MSPLSISNIAWDVSEDEEIAAILLQRGVSRIDLAPSKYFPNLATVSATEVEHVRRRWNDRGISLIGMQSLLFGTTGLNVFGDSVCQDRLLSHLESVFKVGAELGITKAVFGSPRNRLRGARSDSEALHEAVDFFRRAGDLAMHHDMILCLEPNPTIYGADFMTNIDLTASVAKAAAHPGIGMQWDTGAMFINQEDPATAMNGHASIVGHIHISEPQLAPIGSSEIDHAPMAQAMDRLAPHLTRTIEMLRPDGGPTAVALAIDAAQSAYGKAGQA